MYSFSDLTICIPTYNRPQRIKKQLQALSSQRGFDSVQIIISDNSSEYDVSAFVNELYPNRDNIRVYKNPVNLGGDANFCLLFLRCQTKWMWLLGDDDHALDCALSIILADINKLGQSNVALIKYSIEGFTAYDDTRVANVRSFINYYHESAHTGGEMIFISNNVYNCDVVKQFYGDTLSQSYCRVSQLLPIFNALNKGDYQVWFNSSKIVKYMHPEVGQAWSMKDVCVGISTLPFVDLDLSYQDYYKLMRIISSGFSHSVMLKVCLDSFERRQGKFLYHHLYRVMFNRGRFVDICLYILFHFCYYMRLSSSSCILNLINKKGK